MYFTHFITYHNLKYIFLWFYLFSCSLNNCILHLFELLTKKKNLVLFRFNLRIIHIFSNLTTHFYLLFDNFSHLTILILYTISYLQRDLFIHFAKLIIYISLYLSLLICNQTRQILLNLINLILYLIIINNSI